MHATNALHSTRGAGAEDMRKLLEARGSHFGAQRLVAGIAGLANDGRRCRLHAEHADDENDTGDNGLYEGEPSWLGSAGMTAGARDWH
jgi:hypothetical protein